MIDKGQGIEVFFLLAKREARESAVIRSV